MARLRQSHADRRRIAARARAVRARRPAPPGDRRARPVLPAAGSPRLRASTPTLPRKAHRRDPAARGPPLPDRGVRLPAAGAATEPVAASPEDALAVEPAGRRRSLGPPAKEEGGRVAPAASH